MRFILVTEDWTETDKTVIRPMPVHEVPFLGAGIDIMVDINGNELVIVEVQTLEELVNMATRLRARIDFDSPYLCRFPDTEFGGFYFTLLVKV